MILKQEKKIYWHEYHTIQLFKLKADLKAVFQSKCLKQLFCELKLVNDLREEKKTHLYVLFWLISNYSGPKYSLLIIHILLSSNLLDILIFFKNPILKYLLNTMKAPCLCNFYFMTAFLLYSSFHLFILRACFRL